VAISAKEPIRTWTSKDGRALQARYLEMVGNKVKMKTAQGREFTIPVSRFSNADQKYLKKIISSNSKEGQAQSSNGNPKTEEYSLFTMPEPFDKKGKGAAIITFTQGSVKVVEERSVESNFTDYEEDTFSQVVVGEMVPVGLNLVTGKNSEVHLLLTNGSIAYLGPESSLLLSAFWQNEFEGSNKNVSGLVSETSPSRLAFVLEEGDLVVEVKKLRKSSTFWIKTKLAHAGIRGTKFRLSASDYGTTLSVLEGKVELMDRNQNIQLVRTAEKVAVKDPAQVALNSLAAIEMVNIKRILAKVRKSSTQFSISELAETVEGFSKKASINLDTIKDLQLLFVRPGKIPSPTERGKFVLIRKGFYMSKYEITNQQYLQVMNPDDPSEFKTPEASVRNISWHKANTFCEKLTNQERQKGSISDNWEFSLPTEVEWLHANSAGSGHIYWWGSSFAEDNATLPHPWGFEHMNDNYDEWSSTVANQSSTNPNTWYRFVMAGGNQNRNISLSLTRPLSRRASPREESNYVGFRICLRKP